jgi:hypothetical protein
VEIAFFEMNVQDPGEGGGVAKMKKGRMMNDETHPEWHNQNIGNTLGSIHG